LIKYSPENIILKLKKTMYLTHAFTFSAQFSSSKLASKTNFASIKLLTVYLPVGILGILWYPNPRPRKTNKHFPI